MKPNRPSKPHDIPQDAWDAANAVEVTWSRDGTSISTRTTLVDGIARAIMAERERCAKMIEDNEIIDDSQRGQSLRPRIEGNRAGLAYATAIRKGQPN